MFSYIYKNFNTISISNNLYSYVQTKFKTSNGKLKKEDNSFPENLI